MLSWIRGLFLVGALLALAGGVDGGIGLRAEEPPEPPVPPLEPVPVAEPESAPGVVPEPASRVPRRVVATPRRIVRSEPPALRAIPVIEAGSRATDVGPEPRSLLEERGLGPEDVVTVVLTLRHLSSSAAIGALLDVLGNAEQRPTRFGTDFRAGEVPGTPKVILTGEALLVDHALRILRTIDVPSGRKDPEEVVTIYDPEFADANALAQTLQYITQSSGRGPQAQQPRIIVDSRTGKLLVQAWSPEQKEEIARLIRELDVPLEEPPREVRLIAIRHLAPQTVASHLESLLEGAGAPASQRRTMRPGVPTSAPVRSVSASSGPVRILVHSEANALIVEAPTAAFEKIERLVELLDVAPEKEEGAEGHSPAAPPTGHSPEHVQPAPQLRAVPVTPNRR